MKSLHQLLRSERGDLLLESMFAAVLLTIVIPSTATLIFAATASATASDSTIGRTSLLNSVLTDESPRAGSYTAAPATVQRQLLGKTVQVTVWADSNPAGGTLRAAMPKDGAAADACSTPASLDPSLCLTASAALPAAAGVTVKNILTPGTAGALYDITVPAGATELRYVFKADTVPADSEVVFGNRDHPDAVHIIPVASGQAGYFYGRILVTAGDRLTVSTSGPATFKPESFTVYEAPR